MRFAVAQSGGPTAAINASLAGVYEAVMELSRKYPNDERLRSNVVYGVRHGIQGLFNEKMINLQEALSNPHDLALLKKTPSSALGSCRFRLPDAEEDDSLYHKIRAALDRYQIDAFLYIGGNDSMDTVAKLSKWLKEQGSHIQVIGVPKTIDNDLEGTDHTPGFGSAVKYLNMTLQEIVRDCSVYQVQSVTIVEIMGRDAGWLTASSCLLRTNGEISPNFIYLPESDFTVAQFLSDVRDALKINHRVICAVSEGVRPPDADLFRSGENDEFGHAYLSGIGKYLEKQVQNHIGCKVRSVELNIMQRCSAHVCSFTDLCEAERCGKQAVLLAVAGESGKMVSMRRGEFYDIVYDNIPAEEAANKVRLFPKKWITPAGNQICDEAIDYFMPLIQGEVYPEMSHGMPMHFQF
ncbi:MAG: diphosphate--fructose-6-phosphate 1-phosphotransferase [Oscillospiraceae bacterium]|nr:diphosphate--fructose-6-phosphate 1-phosphotransferase [Oscillospiraceae bacterium]